MQKNEIEGFQTKETVFSLQNVKIEFDSHTDCNIQNVKTFR